jgi:chorismate synthase
MTTYGKSHGLDIGVMIEGCPSGLEISLNEIQHEVDRRRPGQSLIASQRKEGDKVEILHGIVNGKTSGEPIELRILNKDVDLSGYENLKYKPRPGHADFTWYKKYGYWYAFDKTGGRETAGRVLAGAVAKKLLRRYKIDIFAHSLEIAGIRSKSYYEDFDLTKIEEYKRNIESNSVRCIDAKIAKDMENAILKSKEKGDSVGGVVEVIATSVPAGLGEPNYNKLNASLYYGFGSIPAVIGIYIGLYERVRMHGSKSNDEFYIKNGKVITKTNYCGGILGGISDGMPIVASIGFKPTPSITKRQHSVDLGKMEETEIEIKGRHDSCIVPRAGPVVEAMMALVLADNMLLADYIPKKLERIVK